MISLQAQTRDNFEHVVKDAGSTDGSLNVLKQRADPRLVLTSDHNRGIYDALNHGYGADHRWCNLDQPNAPVAIKICRKQGLHLNQGGFRQSI